MGIDLENLSLDELMALNRRVADRIRYLHQLKMRSQMDKFELGDRICFQKDGRTVEGTISRINKKTVSVCAENEGHWNIHPGFLTKMPPANHIAASGLVAQLTGLWDKQRNERAQERRSL